MARLTAALPRFAIFDKGTAGHVQIVASAKVANVHLAHATKLLRPSQVPTFKLGRLVTGRKDRLAVGGPSTWAGG
jgi:hypothetical protein